MPIATVLQRFVDDELERAPALIERAVAGTLMLLRDAGDGAVSPTERAQQLMLAEALESHTLEFQRAFLRALAETVGHALADPQRAARAEPAAGLELMDESRVEIDIEISRAMQLIDSTAEWELRELQTFTSTLVGQAHVSAESNPLRPLAFATALWQAACVVHPLQAQRARLLRTSAGVAAGLLKSAWAAACRRLEAQGVVPGTYRTVVLAPGSARSAGPAGASSAAGGIASLLASMPSGPSPLVPGGTPRDDPKPAPASAEFEQALLRLDEVLRHLPQATEDAAREPDGALVKRLNLHRGALMSTAASARQRQTIALLARLFDAMLADRRVATPFAALIARLQGSALRIALRDPSMLETSAHPVWRLIDRIGAAGAAYPQRDDPRAASLLAFCRRLAEPLGRSAAVEAAHYQRAETQLDAFLQEQVQAQRQEAERSVRAMRESERREVLEQQLAQRLAEQMAPMQVDATIRRFLTTTWSRVIAESMLRFGEQADTTRGTIKAVDELLWSVQLPDHPQSRQRLVALLPGLLQQLRAGMALIDLPAAEQQTVFDALMTIHTEALRPGGRGDPAALTPAQIVQRMRDEVLLPPSTGHGAFGDSVIDLGSMETVPAELLPESKSAPSAAQIESLRVGGRLRLFVPGRWSSVQLLWRSDHGLYFLFAGETAARTHSITRRALEKLNLAGLMQPFEAQPLVQRALDRVGRELAGPL